MLIRNVLAVQRYLPLDLRPKKTRAIRRRLTPHQVRDVEHGHIGPADTIDRLLHGWHSCGGRRQFDPAAVLRVSAHSTDEIPRAVSTLR